MGLSQMTCTELTEQDDVPHHQLHELCYEGPLWCLEESTHLSMNQRERRTGPNDGNFIYGKKNLKYLLMLQKRNDMEDVVECLQIKTDDHQHQSINQSNFYRANVPSVARLSGETGRSVFKYKVVEVVP